MAGRKESKTELSFLLVTLERSHSDDTDKNYRINSVSVVPAFGITCVAKSPSVRQF